MSPSIPHERTLRKITIATLLPAFPLLLTAGTLSATLDSRSTCYRCRFHPNITIIFFGLIPSFISAITSLLFLKAYKDPTVVKRSTARTTLKVLLDGFLAAANFAVLVPVWVFEPGHLYGQPGRVMVEAYATVFLMSDMFIHAYLGLYHPCKWLSAKYKERALVQTECPHCHGKLRAVGDGGRKSEGYSLLRAEEYLDVDEDAAEGSAGVGRQSMDSEA